MQRLVQLLLFLSSFYQISMAYLLNYTLYKGNPQSIYLPSRTFAFEDPFASTLTIRKIISPNFGLSSNISTATYSDVIPNMCSFDPFHITIYPLKIIPIVNASKNFEFISIANYIYYYDTNANLLIYYIDTNSDGIMTDITLVNQYVTRYSAGDSSYLILFYDEKLGYLYLVINNMVNFYFVSTPGDAVDDKTLYMNWNTSNAINKIDYINGCFVVLTANKFIDMHCLNIVGDGFDDTTSLGENDIINLLTTQNVTFDRNNFNFTDFEIDEYGVLVISEYNIGIIFIDISNTKNPVLLGIQVMYGATMVKKFYQSLMVIKQFQTNNSFIENHFEEYFTILNTTASLFSFQLNKAFLLDYGTIKSVHIAKNYLIILQNDAMKLYRHSLNKLIDSNLVPIDGFINDGLLNLHRFDGNVSGNIFIGIFPYRLGIYNIDILNISLSCSAPVEIQTGDYFFNFTVFSTYCSEMGLTIFTGNTFPVCYYPIPAVTAIYDSGTTVEQNDKTGLIAGLVVGLFFAVVVIVICAIYLFKVTRKYDQLEERKGKGQGNLRIIGGDNEKNSIEPNHLEPVGGYSNKIELESNKMELESNNINRA